MKLLKNQPPKNTKTSETQQNLLPKNCSPNETTTTKFKKQTNIQTNKQFQVFKIEAFELVDELYSTKQAYLGLGGAVGIPPKKLKPKLFVIHLKNINIF